MIDHAALEQAIRDYVTTHASNRHLPRGIPHHVWKQLGERISLASSEEEGGQAAGVAALVAAKVASPQYVYYCNQCQDSLVYSDSRLDVKEAKALEADEGALEALYCSNCHTENWLDSVVIGLELWIHSELMAPIVKKREEKEKAYRLPEAIILRNWQAICALQDEGGPPSFTVVKQLRTRVDVILDGMIRENEVDQV